MLLWSSPGLNPRSGSKGHEGPFGRRRDELPVWFLRARRPLVEAAADQRSWVAEGSTKALLGQGQGGTRRSWGMLTGAGTAPLPRQRGVTAHGLHSTILEYHGCLKVLLRKCPNSVNGCRFESMCNYITRKKN